MTSLLTCFLCFLHELTLEAPTESERCDMLCGLAKMAFVGNDVSFEQLAKRTAGLVLADFVALFTHASNAAAKRLLHDYPEKLRSIADTCTPSWFPWKLEQELSSMGVKLCKQDFEDSLEILQSSLLDAIGAPKIPGVKWEDVGGLAEVKAEILDTVQLPLQHPELFAAGLRRSGIAPKFDILIIFLRARLKFPPRSSNSSLIGSGKQMWAPFWNSGLVIKPICICFVVGYSCTC